MLKRVSTIILSVMMCSAFLPVATHADSAAVMPKGVIGHRS